MDDAIEHCRERVTGAMTAKVRRIAVCNTFINSSDFHPYQRLAKEHGYMVNIILMQNEFDNVHQVPEDTVETMKEKLFKDVLANFYP